MPLPWPLPSWVSAIVAYANPAVRKTAGAPVLDCYFVRLTCKDLQPLMSCRYARVVRVECQFFASVRRTDSDDARLPAPMANALDPVSGGKSTALTVTSTARAHASDSPQSLAGYPQERSRCWSPVRWDFRNRCHPSQPPSSRSISSWSSDKRQPCTSTRPGLCTGGAHRPFWFHFFTGPPDATSDLSSRARRHEVIQVSTQHEGPVRLDWAFDSSWRG